MKTTDEQIKKSYYAVIPANVRYDLDLAPNAKLLYGEITALCNEKGYCWTSNSYFSELYNVTNKSISRWISQLINKGYIHSEIIYKEGTKHVLNRYLRISNGSPMEEKVHTPMDKKVKENITKEYIVEIITYLNNAANKSYRSTTKKTKDLIKARCNEGFKLKDFKKVIDNKTNDWLNDQKMNKFLRPETLFGNKFESYLNEGGKTHAASIDYSQYNFDKEIQWEDLPF